MATNAPVWSDVQDNPWSDDRGSKEETSALAQGLRATVSDTVEKDDPKHLTPLTTTPRVYLGALDIYIGMVYTIITQVHSVL
jgi:hypothetical protein